MTNSNVIDTTDRLLFNTDRDECLDPFCAENSRCVNTPGSFECICLTGFAGNGFDLCKGKNISNLLGIIGLMLGLGLGLGLELGLGLWLELGLVLGLVLGLGLYG